MAIFQTTTRSVTGSALYSDQAYCSYCSDNIEKNGKKTSSPSTLNVLANIPILGRIAGVVRIVLALIHMIGHAIARAVTGNKGHGAHVVKGAAELLRGVVEAIPIIGEAFSWWYNPGILTKCYYASGCGDCSRKPSANFFLVKIFNPDEVDVVDDVLGSQARASTFFA